MDSCTTETMPDGVMAKDVPVQIEGATYSCFMTNDCDALAQRLLSLGCRAPQDDDFKDKPDLPKPLQDAMLQLGATHSLTVSNNTYALGRHIPGAGSALASLLDLCDTGSTRIPDRAAESLMLAVARNDSATVAQLVEAGAVINEVSVQGLSPLMVAARFNATDAARILLDQGADVDLQKPRGRTALCYAAGCRALETARLLMERGADVNSRDDFGITPLIEAVRSNCLEMASMLVQNGANPNLGSVKNTPLIHAVRNNSLNMIELLVSYGVNVNRRDICGSTPLMMAQEHGFTEAARLLAAAGATMRP